MEEREEDNYNTIRKPKKVPLKRKRSDEDSPDEEIKAPQTKQKTKKVVKNDANDENFTLTRNK
jgi:hypothetical protein